MSNDYITSKDLAKDGLTGVARLEEERLESEVKKEIWNALQSASKKKKKEKEPKRKKK